MFPGSPAPLPTGTPLRSLLRLITAPGCTGVWLRECPSPILLHAAGGRRLLLCRDLGILLRRCERVAVRNAGVPDLLTAAQLVRCRVLEVVLGTPFLPPPAQLRELFPALTVRGGVVRLPIGLGSPEEALALCAAGRVAVRSSRIRYTPYPVDGAAPGSLG